MAPLADATKAISVTLPYAQIAARIRLSAGRLAPTPDVQRMLRSRRSSMSFSACWKGQAPVKAAGRHRLQFLPR